MRKTKSAALGKSCARDELNERDEKGCALLSYLRVFVSSCETK
jgi:hypothetical protein